MVLAGVTSASCGRTLGQLVPVHSKVKSKVLVADSPLELCASTVNAWLVPKSESDGTQVPEYVSCSWVLLTTSSSSLNSTLLIVVLLPSSKVKATYASKDTLSPLLIVTLDWLGALNVILGAGF